MLAHRYGLIGADRELERQLGPAARAPAGPLPWLDERRPDVICLQETRSPADRGQREKRMVSGGASFFARPAIEVE